MRRHGSWEDAARLAQTFSTFGFEIDVHHNLPAADLEELMADLAANKQLFQYASLVVCLLSHGSRGCVQGSDNRPVSIEKLQYKFNSANCPALFGKPKIYIVQACQGEMQQTPFGLANMKWKGSNLFVTSFAIHLGRDQKIL